MEEGAPAGVVLAVFSESAVHIGEARADAVLVPFQRVEVDGVGEVRGEELVGLGFQPGSVRRQIGKFLVLAGVALVECRINVGRDSLVGGVTNRDARVGVRDETFRDRDGNRASGTGRLLRSAAGADEVGVGDTAWVGGEVEQHPRPTGAAVQQALEVVGVLDVPGHLRRPRPEQRLHLVEQRRLHDGIMRARMQRTFVADHSRVVRVRQELVERVLPQRLRRTLRRRHRE